FPPPATRHPPPATRHPPPATRHPPPVRTYMPEDEFRVLVEQMARLEQKYIHYPNPVPRELRKSGERAE
ncbi:MAG: hypothetical protein ACJ796_16245, partial [Gemmatimonadaceae bacterium]